MTAPTTTLATPSDHAIRLHACHELGPRADSPALSDHRPGDRARRRAAAADRLLHRQRRAADDAALTCTPRPPCSSSSSPATPRRTRSCSCSAAGSATPMAASGCSSSASPRSPWRRCCARWRPSAGALVVGARPAGRSGRADGPADAVDDPGHRQPGLAVAGARLVRRDRRARRRHRSAARRGPGRRRTSPAAAGAPSSSSTSRSGIIGPGPRRPATSRRRTRSGVRQIDVVGTMLLAVTLIAVLLPLTEGRALGWPTVVVAAARAGAAQCRRRSPGSSARWSARGGAPLVPPSVLRAPQHAPRPAARRPVLRDLRRLHVRLRAGDPGLPRLRPAAGRSSAWRRWR